MTVGLAAVQASATAPNLTGSWHSPHAPTPRSTFHLTTSNGLQTLTMTWQGVLTHSGLHGRFVGTLNAAGTEYAGTFHVTEASVVVDGTGTITIDTANRITVHLVPSSGNASSFTLVRQASPPIRFSFRGYTNDVKVVPPLVGPWQLGYTRINGSGALSTTAGISSTIYNSFEPHGPYAPAHMHARVIGWSYSRGPHGSYTKLTMTIEITETNAKSCAPGDQGTLKLLQTTQRLKNGALGDAIGLSWANGRCPTFVQGWINADGGAKTSPQFGGPPHGGQWAIVKISTP